MKGTLLRLSHVFSRVSCGDVCCVVTQFIMHIALHTEVFAQASKPTVGSNRAFSIWTEHSALWKARLSWCVTPLGIIETDRKSVV